MTSSEENQDKQPSEDEILISYRYRVWIEDTYIGHFRMGKRINFSRIIAIIRQIAGVGEGNQE